MYKGDLKPDPHKEAHFTLNASRLQVCCDSQSEACILKSMLHIGCRNELEIGLHVM